MSFLHFETSPHLLKLFRGALQCCFAVKHRKYLVDYETSPDFPSTRGWVHDDWTSYFLWTVPLRFTGFSLRCRYFCLAFVPCFYRRIYFWFMSIYAFWTLSFNKQSFLTHALMQIIKKKTYSVFKVFVFLFRGSVSLSLGCGRRQGGNRWMV